MQLVPVAYMGPPVLPGWLEQFLWVPRKVSGFCNFTYSLFPFREGAQGEVKERWVFRRQAKNLHSAVCFVWHPRKPQTLIVSLLLNLKPYPFDASVISPPESRIGNSLLAVLKRHGVGRNCCIVWVDFGTWEGRDVFPQLSCDSSPFRKVQNRWHLEAIFLNELSNLIQGRASW